MPVPALDMRLARRRARGCRFLMPSNAIKVGILGAGAVVDEVHAPVLAEIPDVEIAWLCDQDRERAVRVGRAWGIRGTFDDLRSCPDVDVVLIAIPVGRRREALSVVFERGWHAFVEKPFAISAAEHMRILEAAGRARVEVGVGLMRRFFQATNIAHRAFAGEAFGPVLEIWAAEASWLGATGRSTGDNFWFYLLRGRVHWLDRYPKIKRFENRVSRHVHAHETLIILASRFLPGLRTAIPAACAVANVRRRGGTEIIPMHLVLSRIRDLYTGVVVRCEHATIRFGVAFDSRVEVLGRDDRPLCRLDGPAGATNLYQAFFLEWLAFLEQCRSRKPSRVDATSALLSTRFIETAYRNGDGAWQA